MVEKFNQENGMKAVYRHGPLKSLERLRHKERDLGLVCSAESFERRTQSSKIFDYVRGFGGKSPFPSFFRTYTDIYSIWESIWNTYFCSIHRAQLRP